MWSAIRNACELVSANGKFYLAIYNKVEGRNGSEFLAEGEKTLQPGPDGRRNAHWNWPTSCAIRPYPNSYASGILFVLEEYSKGRGMSAYIDTRDWLGGYPYEFASADEIVRFCRAELGVRLVKVRTVNNLGVNEFFVSKVSAHYAVALESHSTVVFPNAVYHEQH